MQLLLVDVLAAVLHDLKKLPGEVVYDPLQNLVLLVAQIVQR